jgi:predicted nucleic acid-binding protein
VNLIRFIRPSLLKGRTLNLRGGNTQWQVKPNDISSDVYLDLLNQHELGEGETECLALAMQRPYAFCCDDRKARHAATTVLGSDRVIGSLRLLKWSVAAGLFSTAQATEMYETMKAAGGFLPEINAARFVADE